jgi:hypothetical protein
MRMYSPEMVRYSGSDIELRKAKLHYEPGHDERLEMIAPDVQKKEEGTHISRSTNEFYQVQQGMAAASRAHSLARLIAHLSIMLYFDPLSRMVPWRLARIKSPEDLHSTGEVGASSKR